MKAIRAESGCRAGVGGRANIRIILGRARAKGFGAGPAEGDHGSRENEELLAAGHSLPAIARQMNLFT
jgi:hypothetical protein